MKHVCASKELLIFWQITSPTFWYFCLLIRGQFYFSGFKTCERICEHGTFAENPNDFECDIKKKIKTEPCNEIDCPCFMDCKDPVGVKEIELAEKPLGMYSNCFNEDPDRQECGDGTKFCKKVEYSLRFNWKCL